MADMHKQNGIDVLSFNGEKEQAGGTQPGQESAPEPRKPTLEEMLEKIDQISSEMEEGNLPLEETFKKYRQGMDLVKRCAREISVVERQIQVLDEQGDLDDF